MQNNFQCIEEDEIDLRELVGILKRRKKLIFMITGVLTFVAALYVFVIAKPVYEANVTIRLAQIDNKGINPPSNIVKLLESVFHINDKYNKVVFPIVSSVTIPKQTANIIDIHTQGYNLKSTKEKLQSVIQYITNYQNKYLDDKRNQIKETMALDKSQLKENMVLLHSIEKNIKNYQDKIRVISKKNIAFAGLYEIELAKKQDKLVDISKQIFSLRNEINTLQNNLSSQYIQDAQSLGQINLSHKPVKPKKVLIIIVAFITGIILSIFLAFFLEFLKGIKEEDR